MGGWGSTRWGWHTKKQITEATRRVKVSDLHPGWRGFSWHCGDRPAGDITYILNAERSEVRFVYTNKTTGRDFDYTVKIVGLPSNLIRNTIGRRFFICPICGRRAGVLYLEYGGPTFACRRCCGLTYRSAQTAHYYDRSFVGRIFAMLEQLEAERQG